jgi:hypothetical protein
VAVSSIASVGDECIGQVVRERRAAFAFGRLPGQMSPLGGREGPGGHSPGEVGGHEPGVASHATDEAGIAPVQEPQAQHVKARDAGHAAAMRNV